MVNNELFKKVKDLNLPIGEYALFGSAPMGIRGLRECNDVDIIVTEKLWNEYKSKQGWKFKRVKGYDSNKYFEGLQNDDIELWKDWWPKWDIKNLIQEAEIINSLPFVKLEKVLKWKKYIAREKDLKDIKIIEKFLQNNK